MPRNLTLLIAFTVTLSALPVYPAHAEGNADYVAALRTEYDNKATEIQRDADQKVVRLEDECIGQLQQRVTARGHVVGVDPKDDNDALKRDYTKRIEAVKVDAGRRVAELYNSYQARIDSWSPPQQGNNNKHAVAMTQRHIRQNMWRPNEMYRMAQPGGQPQLIVPGLAGQAQAGQQGRIGLQGGHQLGVQAGQQAAAPAAAPAPVVVAALPPVAAPQTWNVFVTGSSVHKSTNNPFRNGSEQNRDFDYWKDEIANIVRIDLARSGVPSGPHFCEVYAKADGRFNDTKVVPIDGYHSSPVNDPTQIPPYSQSLAYKVIKAIESNPHKLDFGDDMTRYDVQVFVLTDTKVKKFDSLMNDPIYKKMFRRPGT